MARKTFPIPMPPIFLVCFAAIRAVLNAKLPWLAIDALAAIILPEERIAAAFRAPAGIFVHFGFSSLTLHRITNPIGPIVTICAFSPHPISFRKAMPFSNG
jgi:hypothetical protein